MSIMAIRLASEKRWLPSNRTEATTGFSLTRTTRTDPCMPTFTVLNSPVACSASTEALILAAVASSPTLSARYLTTAEVSTCLLPITEILLTVAACAASTPKSVPPTPTGAKNRSASAKRALRSSLVGSIMILTASHESRRIARASGPQLTPGRSIYWFFNQGQAARAFCVSKSLGCVHLRNTPKTKVNKYLVRGERLGLRTRDQPLTDRLFEAISAPQETCRRASSRVSLRRVKIIRLPTMAKPTRNPISCAFWLSG